MTASSRQLSIRKFENEKAATPAKVEKLIWEDVVADLMAFIE